MCPPIVHAYIATSLLIEHAYMSKSLGNIYVSSALLMHMNVLFHHACMRISLSNTYVTSAP